MIPYLICIKSILGTYFPVVLPFSNWAIRRFDWWQCMALGYGPLPGELSGFQESAVGIIHSLGWFRFVSCSVVCPLTISRGGGEVVERGHCQQLQRDVRSSFGASYRPWTFLSSPLFTILQPLSHFPLLSHSSKMAALCDWSDGWKKLGHLAFKNFSV